MRKLHSKSPVFLVLWLVFTAAVALYRAVVNPDLHGADGHSLAHLMTGPIYQGLVVVAIGLLLAPSTAGWRREWTGWWVLDASLITFLVSQVCKRLLPWPRPSGHPGGFPSGHTMFAFALAWLRAERFPRLAPLFFLVAAAVGWSRVAVNAHFPYQVVAGAVFGLAIGACITRLRRGALITRLAGAPAKA